ncbi:HNH endonuclease [Streptomyces piniterrae]|uniref:HNH endonuclease n=1 Tax=Streptomyces piniterrae TaxID=2571125 RepID=A0A4U0NN12_9ACTN|nr:HNH endonuclease signature motif containing protein [Streptomyces piniterrae]TJZ55881.1 HNH endonuclease [Streptomyces piniterrae]
MTIGSPARKVLWARSGNLCAFLECNQLLTYNLHDEESRTLEESGIPLGEEAHIISGSPDGPRYDPNYPNGKVDDYENLILLCPTHHRIIDKKGGAGFSSETLREMKRTHEVAQAAKKSPSDLRREEIELRTLAMVENWVDRAALSRWGNLTYRLNQPVVSLKESWVNALYEQGEWLMMRNWPDFFPGLKSAFANYQCVLRDLVNHIRSSMEYRHNSEDRLEFPRPWQRGWLPQEKYDKARKEFEFSQDMLYELSWELTKAANYVCDLVRTELDPLFRFEEGALPYRIGDGLIVDNLSREEYSYEERNRQQPYEGLSVVKERVRAQGGASR